VIGSSDLPTVCTMITPLPCTRKLAALACVTVLAGAILSAHSASLFGDLSCQSWGALDYARKKDWTNAFLAPLSLTHQGLQRTAQDHYNDDPKAFEPAILGIDNFCRSNPALGPADGAVAYLNSLMSK
jgi:hypothetical protein